MKTLRLASFGIRGRVGESLTPSVAIDFACAFGSFCSGKVVLLGRDTRGSSEMFHAAVVSALLSTGCRVVDMGVCPEPILQFSVEPMAAAGAISISGGHTRMGYNALTLINSNGSYLDPIAGEIVLDMYHSRDFSQKAWDGVGRVDVAPELLPSYLDALADGLDVDAISDAGFTVVIDPVNGAGCGYLAPFAERLGINLVAINADESGHLAHDPEPRPRNAKQAASVLRHVGAKIGFVTSSDMSRLSIVSEDGRTASEEYTLPLVADHVLDRGTGTVVTNYCTSTMLEDVAVAHGAEIKRTKVGQAFIVAALADEDGVVGGEGNGSVVVPSFSKACDAFYAMGLILESMAQKSCCISELMNGLPRYHIVKKQVHVEPHRGYRAIESLREHSKWADGAEIDAADGIRADWDDGWLHVRASHTESMVRVISEAKSQEVAESRAMDAVRFLEGSTFAFR